VCVCVCVCECVQLFGNFFLNLSRLSETVLINKLTTQIIIKSGFLWEFGPGQLTSFFSSLVMKLGFISQPSSKSTLPFAGLQHMQQCQVNFRSIFAPGF
jgi:hypothetical protein